MANKTKATPQKEEAREKGPETPDAPLPLLDLSDAAVTKMIKQATKRGYVTHEQLNAVIPSEEVTSEQIENILAMLNEMGINVVETGEAEADEEEAARGPNGILHYRHGGKLPLLHACFGKVKSENLVIGRKEGMWELWRRKCRHRIERGLARPGSQLRPPSVELYDLGRVAGAGRREIPSGLLTWSANVVAVVDKLIPTTMPDEHIRGPLQHQDPAP